MAELVGVVASAITVGASAAQLSLALFSIVQTLKNAPQEMAEIAQEVSLLSGSLLTLGDVLNASRQICKPALFRNTDAILRRYSKVESNIKKLIDTPQKLVRLAWCIQKPKAKSLLKKVEGIKTALTLELNIIQLARAELGQP
jgi:hypothetical protein